MSTRAKKGAAPSAPNSSPDVSQAIDDVCVVAIAHADGDPMDSPDVVPCLERLRLHREGRPVPGYPKRSGEEIVSRPRRKEKP